MFYYMVRESLCYLTMTESSYPKRMAFQYLDEVADAILSELVNEFQENVSDLLASLPILFSLSCLTCQNYSGVPKLTKLHVRSDLFITTPSSRGNNENSEILVEVVAVLATITGCKKI